MVTGIRIFTVFIFLLFIISGCQKELSTEDINTGGSTSGTGIFSLSGAPGNCTSPIINGVFQAGISTDPSNTIAVPVQVTTIGTYTISSTSVNGIHFSSTGTFTATGLQNIVFTASGTPLAAGSFNFILGTGGCTFPITILPAVANNGDCKACIYLPFCEGSRYEYNDTLFNPLITDTIVQLRHANYISAVDTTIAGSGFKKIQVSDGANITSSYINCVNGETHSFIYSVQSTTSGNVLLDVKSTELKANATVGTSWSDTALFSNGNALYRKHTIVQKNITRRLLGVTYNDVIEVSVDQSVLYVEPPVGLVPGGITEYYIAKGIGLIETITYGQDPLSSQNYVAYHSVLKSHFIP